MEFANSPQGRVDDKVIVCLVYQYLLNFHCLLFQTVLSLIVCISCDISCCQLMVMCQSAWARLQHQMGHLSLKCNNDVTTSGSGRR